MTDLHPSIAHIPMPDEIKCLPLDHRGMPVPFFVAYVEQGGKYVPDHRCVDHRKHAPCVQRRLCWICGQKLFVELAFALGPMCTVNRLSSEPPAHRACALYAIQACPFLSRPHMVRRETGLPEGVAEPAGVMVRRNPGATCLWITDRYRLIKDQGGVGFLYEVGSPTQTVWYAEGRPATRAEAEASLAASVRTLEEAAAQGGRRAQRELAEQIKSARVYLPAA